MNLDRALPVLAMLALLFAPFGRMAAEAKAMPHHAPMAAAGHCDTMPASDPGDEDKAVDCMIACAVMTPAEAPAFQPPLATAAAPVGGALAAFDGLHPEADPPPPRFS